MARMYVGKREKEREKEGEKEENKLASMNNFGYTTNAIVTCAWIRTFQALFAVEFAHLHSLMNKQID